MLPAAKTVDDGRTVELVQLRAEREGEVLAMAAPATSLNLAKIGVPARIGIGLGVAVVTALTYWVIFYAAVAQKIQQTQRPDGSQLNAELAAQKQAQASYFADRDELALRSSASASSTRCFRRRPSRRRSCRRSSRSRT